MLRLIHNRGIVKYVLALVGMIIALYFAWMFYPFGEWSGKQFLSDIPAGPALLGLTCAAIMGGLVLLLLFHKEYMREDVKAYGAIKGDPSFERALDMFVWFVMALEGFSILFRAIILNFSRMSWVLVGVGVVGMALTYVISKVLHAQVNRPASVEAARLINDASNTVLTRASKDLDKLSNDDLRNVGQGQFHPFNRLQDMRDSRKRSKEQKQLAKAQADEQRHMDWLVQQRQGQDAASQFLNPRTGDPVDIMPSNNGHSKRTVNFE
jgi:hypothetical protein